jgi:hypothetical protein
MGFLNLLQLHRAINRNRELVGERRRQCFFAVALRLRPVLIRASRVLPSTPPLSQRVERHFFDGQFGGFSLSGIHLWPQTSQTATRIVFQPMQPLYRILPIGHNIVDV